MSHTAAVRVAQSYRAQETPLPPIGYAAGYATGC